MKNKLFLILVPLVLGYGIAFGVSAPPPTNILVILCDDLGYGDTSLSGHPVIQTPRIEALRKQSAFCTNYYAPANICSPSRAAMLTGRMPYRLGIYSFIRDAQDYVHLDADEVTLPQVLKKAGYQSANIGKWHVSHLDAIGPHGLPTMRDYGFDYWLGSDNNLKIHDKPDWWRNEKRVGTIKGYAATVVSDEVQHWLSNVRDPKKPFLLFANYYEPHADSDAPKALIKKYEALGQDPGPARYFACIEHLDTQVGRVLDRLDALNLTKDTLVLFTSDHGPNPTSTSRYGTAKPYRGTKYQVWDGSTHVPALIRWPGVVAAGSTLDQPMGSIDLLHTFAAVAGASAHLPTDRPLDGTDCSPLLRGAESVPRSTPLQWHYYKSSAKLLKPGSPQAAMRIGDQVIAGWYESPLPFNNVRWMPIPKQNGGIKEMDYVRGTGKHTNARPTRFSLYDMANDPHQNTDLFDPKNPKHLALRDRLVTSHETLRRQAPDRPLDGTDCSPLLRGAESVPRSTPLQWHYYKSSAKLLKPGSPQAAMRIGDQVIAGWYESPLPFNNVRWMPIPKQNGGIKEMDYVRGTGKHTSARLTRFSLYDMANDPHQNTDLFDPKNPKHLALRDRLVTSHEILRRQAPGWDTNASRIPAVSPPRIVGTPPADAGRGLVRVSPTEIRHYPGKGGKSFLQSLDNGETWHTRPIPASYPDATCLGKESPSIVPIPGTSEYFRVEPLYRKKPTEGIYRSEGGLDGTWKRIEDTEGNPVLVSGILRTPIWVNQNKRILIPGHGGGCWTWISDDQGATWTRSNKIQAPHHEVGGVHAGTRWNHGMVEATIIEKTDGTLWMIARTAQDQHWQSFSTDHGTTWSPAEPSRFWGTITMPTLFRMQDGRMLFVWSNTTALPEVKREKKRGGEDVFTNRDALHAAISEDDGKTWIGFREIMLDDLRNNPDYAVTAGSNDRGKHQAEVIQLDANRVLFSSGQHPLHRKLGILDVRWLYETTHSSTLTTDTDAQWSTHQYLDKIVGHCGYNRTPGARVAGDGLRLLRVDTPGLTNPNQGATWNFPSGQSGSFSCTIRQEKGGAPVQLALTDRWFNPTDHTVDQFATFVLKTSEHPVLTPGKTHRLTVKWSPAGAQVFLDGKNTGLNLPRKHPTPNGISYVHFYNPATQADSHGFTILNTEVTVQP